MEPVGRGIEHENPVTEGGQVYHATLPSFAPLACNPPNPLDILADPPICKTSGYWRRHEQALHQSPAVSAKGPETTGFNRETWKEG